jgi:hypothetical protein
MVMGSSYCEPEARRFPVALDWLPVRVSGPTSTERIKLTSILMTTLRRWRGCDCRFGRLRHRL